MATGREPTAPSRATIKRLFARSSNRCAFPKCGEAIVQGETIVGEICHIKAANSEGPRYDPQQTAAERHGYDNLVLMCGTHHTVIDADEDAYTVEHLTKLKITHEGRATPISDDVAERASLLLISQPVTTVNQSGGITAHTINVTVNSPRSPSQQAKTWMLQPTKTHLSSFIEDGEILCRPRSLMGREEALDIQWINQPQFFMRLIPSEPHAQMRYNEIQQLMDSARVRPLPNYDYKFSAINKFGAVVLNSENVTRQSSAAQITQVSTFGEIWGIDTRTAVRDGEIKFGEKAIAAALSAYLAFARDTLLLNPPITIITGMTGVEGHAFHHPYNPRRVMFDPPRLPCNHQDVIWQGKISDLNDDAYITLRPFFDHMWDCCGKIREDWFPEEYT
ncbi:MAG TPA: hypothetical protein VGH08_05770 [Chthoniobacterales bacterium]